MQINLHNSKKSSNFAGGNGEKLREKGKEQR